MVNSDSWMSWVRYGQMMMIKVKSLIMTNDTDNYDDDEEARVQSLVLWTSFKEYHSVCP